MIFAHAKVNKVKVFSLSFNYQCSEHINSSKALINITAFRMWVSWALACVCDSVGVNQTKRRWSFTKFMVIKCAILVVRCRAQNENKNKQSDKQRKRKKTLDFRLKFKFVVSVVWHVFTVKFSPGLALTRHLNTHTDTREPMGWLAYRWDWVWLWANIDWLDCRDSHAST